MAVDAVIHRLELYAVIFSESAMVTRGIRLTRKCFMPLTPGSSEYTQCVRGVDEVYACYDSTAYCKQKHRPNAKPIQTFLVNIRGSVTLVRCFGSRKIVCDISTNQEYDNQ